MINISIIIPCYNSSQYIDKCICSLCKQTFKGTIELIFVDDCSSDGTILIIEQLLKEYSYTGNYKIIKHTENKGVAEARITGILSAVGEYIIFCDSDDWMDERMCEMMYSEAINFNSSLVVCDYRNIYSSYDNVSLNNYVEDYLQGLLLCKCTGSLWNKLIKRELLLTKEFVYPHAPFSEDYVYSIQLAILADKIRYVPEPLYNYYHRDGSLVMSTNEIAIQRRIQENLANHRLVEDILKKYQLFDRYYSESLALKLIIKNYIRAYLPRPGYYQLWKDTYPEMTIDIFKSRHIKFRTKVAYFLTLFGVYPYLKKFIH